MTKPSAKKPLEASLDGLQIQLHEKVWDLTNDPELEAGGEEGHRRENPTKSRTNEASFPQVARSRKDHAVLQPTTGSITCTICDVSYDSRSALREHQATAHRGGWGEEG
jgi:hypothetical protein